MQGCFSRQTQRIECGCGCQVLVCKSAPSNVHLVPRPRRKQWYCCVMKHQVFVSAASRQPGSLHPRGLPRVYPSKGGRRAAVCTSLSGTGGLSLLVTFSQTSWPSFDTHLILLSGRRQEERRRVSYIRMCSCAGSMILGFTQIFL